MRNKRFCIFGVIAALLAIAAVVFLFITYQDEITEFFSAAKEKCLEAKEKLRCRACSDDYDD